METQKIKTDSISKDERIETGPLKINDDWTGYFIRGDQALWMAQLARNLEENTLGDHNIMDIQLLHAIKDFGSVFEGHPINEKEN